jgi:single-strand DNA-binding protein
MAGEGIITVTGNLGSDPDLRQTPTGVTVASFNLANTPRVKKDNEWQDGETIWFRCFVWGKDATGAGTELRKGSRVIINGKFSVNTFIDKENNERKALEINVDNYGIIPRNAPVEPIAPIESKIIAEDPIDDPWA